MILKAIPYFEEICTSILIILAVAVTVQTVRLRITKADLRASKSEEVRLTEQLDRVGQQVLTLREKIDEQNAAIREAQLKGAEAQAMLGKVAEYTARLAHAEEELDAILQSNNELKKQAEHLSVCETYELVLRSIAGDLP